MTLASPPIFDPYAERQRGALNSFFAARGTEILGFREDGTTIYLRFRAAPLVPKVQVHVQSTAAGEGGLAAYDPANYFSSNLIDCRAARVQDVTITPLTVGERYVVFLVPVQEDGAGLAVLFDGEGGRPDDLSFIGEQRATLPAAHVLATTSALGPEHTVSGLTARQVLIATAATTALFRALTAADVAGASDAERTFASSSLYTFPGALTVAGLLTAQVGLMVTGGNEVTVRSAGSKDWSIQGDATRLLFNETGIANRMQMSASDFSPTSAGAMTLGASFAWGALTVASDYSGGTGDFTNITAAPLTIKHASGSGYPRVVHLSGSATVAVVYNYQTGKDVYWGEAADAGTYFFRGRAVSMGALTATTGLFATGTPVITLKDTNNTRGQAGYTAYLIGTDSANAPAWYLGDTGSFTALEVYGVSGVDVRITGQAGTAAIHGGTAFYPATGGGLTLGTTALPWKDPSFGYDASNRLDITISSAGVVTYDAVGASAKHLFNDDVDVASGKVYRVNTTQVVGTRVTGYAAFSGSAVNRATAYDTATITLVQLAERVNALQTDLTAHGLIGA